MRYGRDPSDFSVDDVSVGGDLSVQDRGGGLTAMVQFLDVDRDFTVQSGNGFDVVGGIAFNVGGTTTIRTGRGMDRIGIAEYGDPWGPVSFFNGGLRIDMGDGNDTLDLGMAGEPGNSVVVNGRTVLDGGAGEDEADIFGNGNTFEEEPTVVRFELVF